MSKVYLVQVAHEPFVKGVYTTLEKAIAVREMEPDEFQVWEFEIDGDYKEMLIEEDQ